MPSHTSIYSNICIQLTPLSTWTSRAIPCHQDPLIFLHSCRCSETDSAHHRMIGNRLAYDRACSCKGGNKKTECKQSKHNNFEFLIAYHTDSFLGGEVKRWGPHQADLIF